MFSLPLTSLTNCLWKSLLKKSLWNSSWSTSILWRTKNHRLLVFCSYSGRTRQIWTKKLSCFTWIHSWFSRLETLWFRTYKIFHNRDVIFSKTIFPSKMKLLTKSNFVDVAPIDYLFPSSHDRCPVTETPANAIDSSLIIYCCSKFSLYIYWFIILVKVYLSSSWPYQYYSFTSYLLHLKFFSPHSL